MKMLPVTHFFPNNIDLYLIILLSITRRLVDKLIKGHGHDMSFQLYSITHS